jgi:hypothetical protein
MTEQRLEAKAVLWVSLDPAATPKSVCYKAQLHCLAYLIAYPPQLAPAATARSVSISGYLSRMYFQPFCMSTKGFEPQFLRIAFVSSAESCQRCIGATALEAYTLPESRGSGGVNGYREVALLRKDCSVHGHY